MMAVNKGNIEALMNVLGERGRFQLFVHILLSYTYVTLLFNHVIMAFYGSPIPHSCQPDASDFEISIVDSSGVTGVSSYGSSYSSNGNVTSNSAIVSHGDCSAVIHLTDGTNKTMVCQAGQWKYAPTHGENNIVSEFDLVCSDKSMASLATTIYFSGVMVGGLVFGDLADRFGRLPVMLGCLYAIVGIGIVIAFSVNYTMFVILRFVNGILIQGLQTSAYTMIMELYRAKYRPFGGAIAEVFFAGGVMMVAGFAYWFQDWRHLQIAITVPAALAFFYICVAPESLRWLITKGKMDKAEALIRKICRVNKIPYPKEAWMKVKDENQDGGGVNPPIKNYNITYLFRTPKLRKITIVIAFLWCVNSTSYYGVTYKMARFEANRYLVFFIGGAVEMVVYILSIPIMNRFGRKIPLLLSCVIGGVFCICSGLINDHTEGLGKLTAGLALAGRCAFALVFGIVFVYTSELYPTVIRNIGMGFACFWARVGGVLAPQINQWGRNVLGLDAIIVFGIMSVVAGSLMVLLYETNNTKLADSIEEVEHGTSTTPSSSSRSKNDVALTPIADLDKGGDGEPCLRMADRDSKTLEVEVA